MTETILEILIVFFLLGIATYDTVQSRRKNSGNTPDESGIFDSSLI